MIIEKCNGNWNYMYEFEIADNWYPCHLIEENGSIKESDNKLQIFTRNGSIITERSENIRKMRKEQYLKQRSEDIKSLKEIAFVRGYHKNLNDDLALFYNSIKL